ncbi:hypothetical protein C5S36_14230 [Candidatus Methanophagaceae archaeon]|nr:hypothetical protein C5S36_14230 [Methanophagales archaeon]
MSALRVAVAPAVAVKNDDVDTSIDLNCSKCGKPISGEVYEFKSVGFETKNSPTFFDLEH